MAKMSILGLYLYNPEVFSKMSVPDGVDKEMVIANILSQFAELEILYPNWNMMQALIGLWSASELANWGRLVYAMRLDYNPIHNYDRFEEWKDGSSAKGKVAAYNAGAMVDSSEGNSESEHDGHLYGNIGVTTSQQMLEEEIRIRRWTIYDHIADSFKKRFCLLVY